MARHRDVRAINIDEEYDGYYDSCYGHSVEEDFCISPQTEAQFLYNRAAQEKHSMSAFLDSSSPNALQEEIETEDNSCCLHSNSFSKVKESLNPVDKAKLQSCIELMQNVVGETISEGMLSRAAMENKFNVEKALNAVLTGYQPPKTEHIEKDQKFGKEGFKSQSDLGPKLEVIEDEPEVIGRLMISNGKIKSAENVEKSVNQITFEKKSEKILTDCTEELLCHSGITEDLNGKVPPKSVKNEDLNVIAVDSTNRLKSRASGKNVVEAYNKERGGEKPLINLVVVGHVDAGKSTLMGHLLFRLGCVAKKAMHKYEQDSKKLGKASFMYAWVLDETSEERTRGITMDVAQSKFITPHRSVVLLDAPGHKDFIPNMITGAAQADVAVLVVDATRGEFETGFETGGQTREHTMLIRSLGVSQLAVAVNKLDNVNWDQGRYKEIVAKLSSFLKQAGFKEGDVQFVPCSGLTGENLTEPPKISELKSWYSGCCLVDVIDSFKPPERPVSKPFRMCISDVFKGMGSGFCVSGRIEAGYVQNGDRVLVMPAGEQAIIKGITIDDTSMQHSFAGDHVTMQLSGVDANNMSSGSVVCDVARPVKVSAKFQARLVVFNIDTPITKGFPVVLHSQSMSEQAVIKKLVSQLHRSSGQVIKKKPRCLLKNTSAVVELKVIRPICIELYKDFKDLGRFMLRSSGSTIAAGLITEIY